jgi:UDP-glucose 4-epimerase
MARILVAGASGLTGLALVRQLADEHDVIAVARRPAPEGLPASVRWISANVGEKGWTDTLPSKINSVAALFQSPEFRDFPAKAGLVFDTNVGGLQELLTYSARSGVERFVFTSTGGLYAQSGKVLTEDSALTTAGPLGYYLTTKRCGELLVEAYAGLFSTLTLRPFFIYGPGQAAQMLMPRLIDSVKAAKPIGLQGPAGLSINPIHVDDASQLIVRSLQTDVTGVINLAGPEVATLRRIGELVGQLSGVAPVFDVNDKVAAPFVVAETNRMNAALGKASIGLAAGLATMVGVN